MTNNSFGSSRCLGQATAREPSIFFHYRPAQTGTPDSKLANPTPSTIKEDVPNKFTNTTTNAVAVFGLTPNLLPSDFRIRSKYGEIAIDNANRAGRITFSKA